jgi:hypothetical protein
VAVPRRRGFGALLIERGVSEELDGDVSLDFVEPGLRCTMTIPLPDDPLGTIERGVPE